MLKVLFLLVYELSLKRKMRFYKTRLNAPYKRGGA